MASSKEAAPATSSSNHPKYLDMVTSSIKDMGNKKGSSKQAILSHMQDQYNIPTESKVVNTLVKNTLKKGVASGVLLQVTGAGATGRFKVSSNTGATNKKTKPRPAKRDDESGDSEEGKENAPKPKPKPAPKAKPDPVGKAAASTKSSAPKAAGPSRSAATTSKTAAAPSKNTKANKATLGKRKPATSATESEESGDESADSVERVAVTKKTVNGKKPAAAATGKTQGKSAGQPRQYLVESSTGESDDESKNESEDEGDTTFVVGPPAGAKKKPPITKPAPAAGSKVANTGKSAPTGQAKSAASAPPQKGAQAKSKKPAANAKAKSKK